MNYFELIERRESCRDYDPSRPVEQEKLLRCLEAARIAPSACNSQPWHFTAVTDPDVLKILRGGVQSMGMNRFVDDCPALVVITEQAANVSERVAQRFGNREFSSIDIGIATAQFCLAATEQGLSTCILGWLDAADIRKTLNLPKNARVRLVLALGYAKTDAHREKKRKPMAEIATFFD